MAESKTTSQLFAAPGAGGFANPAIADLDMDGFGILQPGKPLRIETAAFTIGDPDWGSNITVSTAVDIVVTVDADTITPAGIAAEVLLSNQNAGGNLTLVAGTLTSLGGQILLRPGDVARIHTDDTGLFAVSFLIGSVPDGIVDAATQSFGGAAVVTLVEGKENILNCDTSGGAFTLTIPNPPDDRTRITILDDDGEFDTNPLTLIGSSFNGSPSIVFNVAFVVPKLYADGVAGWNVEVSAGGADNLGNHIATQTLDMSEFVIANYGKEQRIITTGVASIADADKGSVIRYNNAGPGTFDFETLATGQSATVLIINDSVGQTVTLQAGTANVSGDLTLAFKEMALATWVSNNDVVISNLSADSVGGLTKRGAITGDPSPALNDSIYNLGSVAAAFNVTLAAATGSQSRVMLIGQAVEIFDVTVRVQAGESLSNITNGTRIINTNGSVFLATDRAIGEWDIVRLGANMAHDDLTLTANRLHNGTGFTWTLDNVADYSVLSTSANTIAHRSTDGGNADAETTVHGVNGVVVRHTEVLQGGNADASLALDGFSAGSGVDLHWIDNGNRQAAFRILLGGLGEPQTALFTNNVFNTLSTVGQVLSLVNATTGECEWSNAAAATADNLKDWAPTTAYLAGQAVVTPTGAIVTRIADGTSTAGFNGLETPDWTLPIQFTDARAFVGLSYYYTGQQVVEDELLLERTAAGGVASATMTAGQLTNWTLISQLAVNPFVPAKDYAARQQVTDSNKLYFRIANGTAGATFAADIANWTLLAGDDLGDHVPRQSLLPDTRDVYDLGNSNCPFSSVRANFVSFVTSGTTNGTTLIAPTSGGVNLVLPGVAGADGDFLQVNGAGALSFASVLLTDVDKSAVANNIDVVIGEHTRITTAVASDTVTLPTAAIAGTPDIGDLLEVYNNTGAELVLSKQVADSFLGSPSTVIPDQTGFTARIVADLTWEVVGTGAAPTGNFIRTENNVPSTLDGIESFSFPTPFDTSDGTADADIIVLLTRNGSNLTSYLGVVIGTVTVNGFEVNRDNGIDNPQTFNYVAINKNALAKTVVVDPVLLTPATLHQVRMRRAATQNIPVTVQTALLFDTKDYDDGNIGNTGTGAVTISQNGRYRITAYFSNVGPSNNNQVVILKNAVQQTRAIDSQTGSGSIDNQYATATLDLVAGDIITATAFVENNPTNTSTALHDQPSLEVVQQPTSTVVDPDVVTALVRQDVADSDANLDVATNVLLMTSITAARTILLPLAAAAIENKIYRIKDGGGAGAVNTITVEGNGAETIDGVANIAIAVAFGALGVFTNGIEWFSLTE